MWVSRKEFEKLRGEYCELLKAYNESVENQNVWNSEADDKVDTLTKQMKCSCENYEVTQPSVVKTWQMAQWDYVYQGEVKEYQKVCLDCGWTTTYDTEEDALADKQELLDKQIDALKEQKKTMKK